MGLLENPTSNLGEALLLTGEDSVTLKLVSDVRVLVCLAKLYLRFNRNMRR